MITLYTGIFYIHIDIQYTRHVYMYIVYNAVIRKIL